MVLWNFIVVSQIDIPEYFMNVVLDYQEDWMNIKVSSHGLEFGYFLAESIWGTSSILQYFIKLSCRYLTCSLAWEVLITGWKAWCPRTQGCTSLPQRPAVMKQILLSLHNLINLWLRHGKCFQGIISTLAQKMFYFVCFLFSNLWVLEFNKGWCVVNCMAPLCLSKALMPAILI